MMLFQKQPQFSLSPPSSHRRYPSAPPAVVVQPTRTPGLLSLSKPITPQRQQQQHHQHHQQRQIRTTTKPKHSANHIRSSQPVPGQSSQIHEDPVPTKPVEAAGKKLIPPQSSVASLSTPDKGPRGRQQAKPVKDKTPRSMSASSRGLARRSNTRQPSPPIQPNSASPNNPHTQPFAHGDRNPASNLFDPFLVNSASDSDSGSDSAQPQLAPKPLALRPAPTLSSLPSGKLARRRQPMPASPTPAPSKAVPVPRTNRSHNNMNLSRSDPILSHMPVRPSNRRSVMTAPAATAQWDAFPICDDMTDAGMTPPTTPVRSKQANTFHLGPHTAPLTRTAFPFGGFRTPSPSPPRRTHHRTPSEGVFNMSLDEDSDSSEGLKALFALRRQSQSGIRVSNKEKAGYFASSMFQNSPSPEELPPPSF